MLTLNSHFSSLVLLKLISNNGQEVRTMNKQQEQAIINFIPLLYFVGEQYEPEDLETTCKYPLIIQDYETDEILYKSAPLFDINVNDLCENGKHSFVSRITEILIELANSLGYDTKYSECYYDGTYLCVNAELDGKSTHLKLEL